MRKHVNRWKWRRGWDSNPRRLAPRWFSRLFRRFSRLRFYAACRPQARKYAAMSFHNFPQHFAVSKNSLSKACQTTQNKKLGFNSIRRSYFAVSQRKLTCTSNLSRKAQNCSRAKIGVISRRNKNMPQTVYRPAAFFILPSLLCASEACLSVNVWPAPLRPSRG